MTEIEIIKENTARYNALFAEYNPLSGIGSPIERFPFIYRVADEEQRTIYLPLSMQDLDLIKLLQDKSVSEVAIKLHGSDLPGPISQVLVEFTNLRFKHDFEFWSFLTCKIQDKLTKKIINFRMRLAQRELLVELEEMRLSDVPIRLILLKARQYGGSTLIQMYMLWIQTELMENWHSAICADIEDQAKNIRQMYLRAAKEYPRSVGTITLTPYVGSSKNKFVKERGCIIGIGSMQEPDNLRSYDFSMLHLCLGPGTLIPTSNGFLKKIEDLSVNDQVFTHIGNKTQIKTITRSKPSFLNGSGRAIKIKTWLGQEITMTPNHPVYTNRGWIQAEWLRKDDLLSMPIRKITDVFHNIVLPKTPNNKNGGGKKCNAGGKIVEFNEETGFAFGYYLAEGSIHKRNHLFKEITFTRNDNEYAFADRAIDALRPYISSHTRKKRPNTLTTHEHLYSTVLAKFINDNLGTKENKYIPDWFFNCGESFLKGILKGYLSGDGSKQNGRQGKYVITQISATTVSSSLAMQIRDIVVSLGYGWGAIDIREAGDHYGRNCKKTYVLRWAGISAKNIKNLLGWEIPENGRVRSEKTFIKNGFIWMKINTIQETIVNEIYDIEVDHEDHSFRTISFSVKNSEVGQWKETQGKKPEDLTQTLRSSLPYISMTLEVLESTAKGVGNFFHREWLDAKNKISGYKAVFIPWYKIDIYIRPIKNYSEFIKMLDQPENAYYKFLWDCGATLEGINWYMKFKSSNRYSDWRMQSEFPTTDIEAFQSTGARVFAPDYVQLMRRHCMNPEYIGKLFARGQKGKEAFEDIGFSETPEGNLWVWMLPDKSIEIRNRYVVTVDIGGRTGNADYSTVRVLDRYWLMYGGEAEMVATWKGHLDQDLFAWVACQIAEFYNHALFIVESNSLKKEKIASEGDHYLTILDEIAEHYDNVFARVTAEKVRGTAPVLYGFHMGKNKTMIIDDLNGALRDQSYIERDIRVLDECDTFEYKADGTMGAVDGCHDDLVIPTAMGIWASNSPLAIGMPEEIVHRVITKTKIISEASI